MKIIENKCPNCGASINVKKNEKSTECPYCHKSYLVQKDEKDYIEEFMPKQIHPAVAISIIIILVAVCFFILNYFYSFI